MKKLIYLLTIFCLLQFSCVDDSSVRVMPEFNCADTNIIFTKEEGATHTSLLYTTGKDVIAEYDADWLSVDVNTNRAIYKTLSSNDGEDARVAIVRLISGSMTVTVTVRQETTEPDLSLKIGQAIDNGIGMIFWVDANDNMSGKAVSVKRFGGYAFEASIMAHNATSAVNGYANTALFTNFSENDAVAYCKSLGEGWYLPAREELWDLFDAYNGVSRNDPSFVSAVPNSLSEKEKSSRTIFDEMLTALGGDIMNAASGTNNGESYWSSTENETGDKASWVRFGKSGADLGNKTATTRFVRCMRTIGNYTYPEEPTSGETGLELSANTVTLHPDITALSDVITMISDETDFSINITDNSWLQARIDKSAKTIIFCTLSPNLNGSSRSTTATITAGSGTGAATADITITQRALSSSEFAIGQIIADNGTLKGGIVFWVDETDRSKAKIMSLDREQLKWSTAASPTSTGIDLTGDDGYANTQALSKLANASEMPAIQFCTNKGSGWYWAARKDMEQIFETYNGTPIADITPNTPNLISDYEKACRTAWDNLVSNAGGTIMNTADQSANGSSYWVCRENSAGTKAFYVRFGKPLSWSSANDAKSSSKYVRAIRSISK